MWTYTHFANSYSGKRWWERPCSSNCPTCFAKYDDCADRQTKDFSLIHGLVKPSASNLDNDLNRCYWNALVHVRPMDDYIRLCPFQAPKDRTDISEQDTDTNELTILLVVCCTPLRCDRAFTSRRVICRI